MYVTYYATIYTEERAHLVFGPHKNQAYKDVDNLLAIIVNRSALNPLRNQVLV